MSGGGQGGLEAFWQGLVRSSAVSVIGAVAFALCELWACVLFLDEPTLARLPPTFLKQHESDDHGRITIEAARALHATPGGLHVFYFGPSTARLVLHDADHPEIIERALTEAVGAPVRFWNFTANGETIEEYLVLADHLPDDVRGVVVAPFSDTRHDHLEPFEGGKRRRAQEVFGLDVSGLGPIAATIGEGPSHFTGVYFFDHIDFFAARRAALARLVPPPRAPPPRHRRGRLSHFFETAHKMNVDKNTRALLDRHVRLVRHLATQVADRGLTLVLLEAPVAPAFDAEKPDLRAAYDEKITELAESIGAPYWDLNDEAGLTSADFYDPVHVGEEAARQRYQTVFIAHLAELLKRVR